MKRATSFSAGGWQWRPSGWKVYLPPRYRFLSNPRFAVLPFWLFPTRRTHAVAYVPLPPSRRSAAAYIYTRWRNPERHPWRRFSPLRDAAPTILPRIRETRSIEIHHQLGKLSIPTYLRSSLLRHRPVLKTWKKEKEIYIYIYIKRKEKKKGEKNRRKYSRIQYPPDILHNSWKLSPPALCLVDAAPPPPMPTPSTTYVDARTSTEPTRIYPIPNVDADGTRDIRDFPQRVPEIFLS